MGFSIGYDFDNNKIIHNEIELKENKEEEKIAKKIISIIPELKIEHKSENYTTLCYNGWDIVRITINSKSKYLSLSLSNDDRKNNRDNPLFNSQKNKNQNFWRTNYNEDSFDVYIDYIKKSMEDKKQFF